MVAARSRSMCSCSRRRFSTRAASATSRCRCSSLSAPHCLSNCLRRCCSRAMASSPLARAWRSLRKRRRITSRRAMRASCRVSISESSRTFSMGCCDWTSTPQSATSWATRLWSMSRSRRRWPSSSSRSERRDCMSRMRPARRATWRTLRRREILRQAGLFQAVAPGPSGGAEVLFGLGRAAGRRVRVLPGRRVPGIQRGQVFQGRQLPLGRGQPAGHRSAAAGKLVVQHGPLVLGLLDLHLQQPQLVLALFKLLVVGTLHGESAQHGHHGDHEPDGRQGPEARAGPGREDEQPERKNQDPHDEDHAPAR